MTYVWRLRKWRPDRYGHPCRVLARGRGPGPRNVLAEVEKQGMLPDVLEKLTKVYEREWTQESTPLVALVANDGGVLGFCLWYLTAPCDTIAGAVVEVIGRNKT